jgi:hypothetical protein
LGTVKRERSFSRSTYCIFFTDPLTTKSRTFVPVFKLHRDPKYTFVEFQWGLGKVHQIQFATPLEFYITGESGGCTFDSSVSGTGTTAESTDLHSVSSMHGLNAGDGSK